MKNLRTLSANLISITSLVLLLSGCSDAGFISNPNTAGNETPRPEDPGAPAKILPKITIETPANNARLNYENFTTVEASGTCNQKDRLVKLSIAGKSYGSAICDGTNWKVNNLNSLASTNPGNLRLEAVLTDEDGNSASAFRDLVRAPSDRVITLSAQTSTIITKNKLKIFLIIDNSSSMAEEQNRLAEGLRRLTLSLQGFDAQIFVYTTTIQGNKGIIDPKVSYRYNLNGTQTNSTTSPAAPTPYRFIGTVELSDPLGDFTFNASLSRPAFEQKTIELENLVRSIGITGSNNEAGLLSMVHILTASNFESKFKTSLNNGDKAAFLILSDADDKSHTEQIRNYQLLNRTRNWSNISKYEDDVNYQTTTLKREVSTTIDQAEYVRTFAYIYAVEIRTLGLCNGDPCESGTTYRVPTQADLATVTLPARGSVACPTAYIAAYEAQTGKKVSRCMFTATNNRYVDFYENFNTNACFNSFTMTAKTSSPHSASDGKTYNNLYDWILKTQAYPVVPNSCTRAALKIQQSPSYSEVYSNVSTSIKVGYQNSELQALVKNKLIEKFGPKGFLVSAIINKPNEGSTACQAESEEVGTAYLNFLSTLGAQGFSDTICKDDYSAALNSISTFAEQVIRDRMEISLGSLESVKSVTINRGGQAIVVPAKDFSTTFETGKLFLSITRGILLAGDSIYLTVQSK